MTLRRQIPLLLLVTALIHSAPQPAHAGKFLKTCAEYFAEFKEMYSPSELKLMVKEFPSAMKDFIKDAPDAFKELREMVSDGNKAMAKGAKNFMRRRVDNARTLKVKLTRLPKPVPGPTPAANQGAIAAAIAWARQQELAFEPALRHAVLTHNPHAFALLHVANRPNVISFFKDPTYSIHTPLKDSRLFDLAVKHGASHHVLMQLLALGYGPKNKRLLAKDPALLLQASEAGVHSLREVRQWPPYLLKQVPALLRLGYEPTHEQLVDWLNYAWLENTLAAYFEYHSAFQTTSFYWAPAIKKGRYKVLQAIRKRAGISSTMHLDALEFAVKNRDFKLLKLIWDQNYPHNESYLADAAQHYDPKLIAVMLERIPGSLSRSIGLAVLEKMQAAPLRKTWAARKISQMVDERLRRDSAQDTPRS